VTSTKVCPAQLATEPQTVRLGESPKKAGTAGLTPAARQKQAALVRARLSIPPSCTHPLTARLTCAGGSWIKHTLHFLRSDADDQPFADCKPMTRHTWFSPGCFLHLLTPNSRSSFTAQADMKRRRQCGFHFTRYQPSVYEAHWRQRVAGNPHCRGLMPDADGVRDWLEARAL